MTNNAIKDIQRSLNVISSITNKQQFPVQLQALEILTQNIITHIHQLQPAAAPTAATFAKPSKRKAPPLPKPAAASPANPNATIAAVYNPNATATNPQPAAAPTANPA